MQYYNKTLFTWVKPLKDCKIWGFLIAELYKEHLQHPEKLLEALLYWGALDISLMTAPLECGHVWKKHNVKLYLIIML